MDVFSDSGRHVTGAPPLLCPSLIAFVSLISFLLDADTAAFEVAVGGWVREGGVAVVAEVEGVEMPKLATTAVSPISLLNHPPRERERKSWSLILLRGCRRVWKNVF